MVRISGYLYASVLSVFNYYAVNILSLRLINENPGRYFSLIKAHHLIQRYSSVLSKNDQG
jgi:hypothetical protein